MAPTGPATSMPATRPRAAPPAAVSAASSAAENLDLLSDESFMPSVRRSRRARRGSGQMRVAVGRDSLRSFSVFRRGGACYNPKNSHHSNREGQKDDEAAALP